jgi:nicotinamide mononucleotide transporter
VENAPVIPRESTTIAALSGIASLLAVSMALCDLATWLEAASFVTGAICVWLTVRQSIWNFPIGLINVATYCVVFYRAALFADAGLQIVYFVLGVLGWRLWLHGGKDRSPLHVSRAPRSEIAVIFGVAAIGTILLWQLLRHVGGSASFWDALTTSISLASQWLLNRKRLESWAGWIIVDAVYVPLYISKELYLTAVLYGVFLVMASMGLRAWRTEYVQRLSQTENDAPLGAAVP